MIEKKCKKCGANAEWEFDDEYYCEFCAREELDVHGVCAPRLCEMCGDHIDRIYYTDSNDNAFCSVKCALEYNDACELKEEQEDDEQQEM